MADEPSIPNCPKCGETLGPMTGIEPGRLGPESTGAKQVYTCTNCGWSGTPEPPSD